MTTNFAYNINEINSLKSSISDDRISTYLRAARGNEAQALKLYLWNSEISAAFYTPLQGLEVAIRNAIHAALMSKFGNPAWFDVAPLNQHAKELLATAKNKLVKQRLPVDPPHIVAELSFGFWISLLNKEYHQTLWIPGLGKSFPHAHKPRSEIHGTLDHIRILRNRIAHYEPIFSRDLLKDYESLIKAIGWINPIKSIWVDQHSTVNEVMKKRP